MTRPTIDPATAPVAAMVEAARPIFAGRHPMHVGAALADLAAIWLAGHPEQAREELLALHVDYIRKLIPINAAALEERR